MKRVGFVRASFEPKRSKIGQKNDSFMTNRRLQDLKLGKERLSYGQFTNGRLPDSSEYYAGCMLGLA